MKSRFFLRAICWGILLLSASGTVLAQTQETKANTTPPGIEKLHQQDIAATLSQSINQLAALWDDDGVLIGQGEKPLVGKAIIQASLTEDFAKNPEMKVLKYEPEIKNLQVAGNIAYEWGHFNVTQQDSPNSKPTSFQGRFLRVMKIQADGSWKFTRVMWNTESQ
jgi:ketosteroid isomerase-like protein